MSKHVPWVTLTTTDDCEFAVDARSIVAIQQGYCEEEEDGYSMVHFGGRGAPVAVFDSLHHIKAKIHTALDQMRPRGELV